MKYSLLFHCNNGFHKRASTLRYIYVHFLPRYYINSIALVVTDIFCVTYDLQLTSVFANGVPVVWLWWLSSCCAIIIRYKHNSYFISILKLYVPILYTNHHQTSYETARKKCIFCHTLRWDLIIHISFTYWGGF